jgi:hypothetical protein
LKKEVTKMAGRQKDYEVVRIYNPDKEKMALALRVFLFGQPVQKGKKHERDNRDERRNIENA